MNIRYYVCVGRRSLKGAASMHHATYETPREKHENVMLAAK